MDMGDKELTEICMQSDTLVDNGSEKGGNSLITSQQLIVSLTTDLEILKVINDLRESIDSGWGIGFNIIHKKLIDKDMHLELKAYISNLVMEKINSIFKRGVFNELYGSDELLLFLGVEDYSFPKEVMDDIIELYEKFNSIFLESMSPSLYNGKLLNGKPYDKIEYSKERFRKNGYSGLSDEELTVLVNKVWNYREILIKLYQIRIDINKISGLSDIRQYILN